jgi:hypothetical protein
MFSAMLLPGIKADLVGPITSARQSFNRLSRILVMYLYTMLQHDIGLNSPIFEGLGASGTRLICVEFTSLNSLLDVKNEPTAFKTSSFTIRQCSDKTQLPFPSTE